VVIGDDKSGLQFDRAEYADHATPQTDCTACRRPLRSIYYEVNGQVTCSGCKVELCANGGSPLGRFLRASLLGFAAGAVGAAIWYGVRVVTGYELGLIAIVVGLMVGAAVLKGSNGRGGWAYQALAIFITYTSIVSTYVPDIVTAMADGSAAQAAGVVGEPAGQTTANADVSAAAAEGDAAPRPIGPGQGIVLAFVFVLFVVAIAFAAPFLAGIQNAIGILIIGFALYEAWKINKRRTLAVNGPFRVVAAAPGAPAAAAVV
jgi:hypothetical protein